MAAALLVAHQHMAQGRPLEQRVVERQRGATGVAKHRVDAAGQQGVEQQLGPVAGGLRPGGGDRVFRKRGL